MSEKKVKKETVFNTVFECREENLYALTEKDKERIAMLTKNNEYIIIFEVYDILLFFAIVKTTVRDNM